MPPSEELKWIQEEGPFIPEMVGYLRDNHDKYDVFLFFTYLYYPTVVGVPEVADKAIVFPLAHDEPFLNMQIFDNVFTLPKAFVLAVEETWDVTTTTLRGVGQMLTGKRGGEDVGGVIRIAEMTGDISKSEGWLDFIVFMALLSINLGLINLFPIPVLDGGSVVIYVLEIISGREMNDRVKEYLFRFGLSLLAALMIFATWNDVVHLFDRWFNT